MTCHIDCTPELIHFDPNVLQMLRQCSHFWPTSWCTKPATYIAGCSRMSSEKEHGLQWGWLPHQTVRIRLIQGCTADNLSDQHECHSTYLYITKTLSVRAYYVGYLRTVTTVRVCTNLEMHRQHCRVHSNSKALLSSKLSVALVEIRTKLEMTPVLQ